MNVTREYFQPAEVATITIWALLLFLQVITTAFMVFHRSYGPFRAKQLDLIAASVVAECIWFVGLLQSAKFLPEEGAFAICSLWQLWFNFCCGLAAWASILLLRIMKLHLSFNLKIRWANWRTNLLFFVFWGPSVILSLVGTVLQDDIFTVEENTRCEMNNNFLYAMMAYALIFVVGYVVSLLRLLSKYALR